MITPLFDLVWSLPGLLLMLGALILPALPVGIRRPAHLALPVLSYVHLLSLPMGEVGGIVIPGGLELLSVRIDRLSMVWGHIFHIAAILGAVYSWHAAKRRWEPTAGLMYVGAAIGAVFARDLLSLFVFWELTAISSVFLVWAPSGSATRINEDRDPIECFRTGQRYLIIQVASGMLLLAGTLIRHFIEKDGQRFEDLASGDIFAAPLSVKLIFLAFGIKAAFPLLHGWLQDTYPKGTHTGTVLLSAFTTKMAIYALARGFAGTDLLIPLGVTMTLFPIFYAVLENDLRKVLSYSLNNQLGFMCVGVGIGTEMALNGAAGHAFVHILYKSLLFMAMGAVLYRAGTCRTTEIGGLGKSMPWTAAFCIVGSLSISAFPFFSGFVAKSLTVTAAAEAHLGWVFLLLMVASAGVVEHSGIKIPYYGFFSKEEGKRITSKDVKEAPIDMLLAMGATAFLCIAIGLFPGLLYQILPYPVDYVPYTWTHVVDQLQLLLFAALAYVLLKRYGLYPKEARAVFLDADWSYRKALPAAWKWGIEGKGGWLWRSFLYTCRWLIGSFVATFRRWTSGKEGIFAQSWTAGGIAVWTALFLGFYLVFFFVWG